MLKSRKGIGFSVLAIIAFLGVIVLMIWTANQVSFGSKYQLKHVEISEEDMAFFQVETAKKFLTSDLKFSSYQAALDVAARGGSNFPNTYWFCYNEVNPPKINEVNFAVSNSSLEFLMAYVKTARENKSFGVDVIIPDYKCVGVYDPGETICYSKDSSECEDFNTTATGWSVIQTKTPAEISDSDRLFTKMDHIRFYWIYYKLYKGSLDRSPIEIIQEKVNDNVDEDCDEGQIEAAVKMGLDDVCRYYLSLFDSYVKCSYKILCFELGSGACINVQCKQSLPSELCYKKDNQLSLSLPTFSFPSIFSYDSVSVKFVIQLNDTKFRVPSFEKNLQDLVWNLWGAIDLRIPDECVIPTPTPTPTPPTPTPTPTRPTPTPTPTRPTPTPTPTPPPPPPPPT